MSFSIDDLNLPNSVVARLIKEALPEGANVSKDARATIARAASIFVIFITSTSTALARRQNHKTISLKNVEQALIDLEFENFVPTLMQDLEAYRSMVKDKKENKAKKDALAATATPSQPTEPVDASSNTNSDEEDVDAGVNGKEGDNSD